MFSVKIRNMGCPTAVKKRNCSFRVDVFVEKQTEVGENMKKISKILGVLLLIWVALGAVVNTVCAKAIGADYTIWGFNAGWVLIGVAVIIGLLFWAKVLKMPKSVGIKPLAFIVAILLCAGFLMVFVETPTPSASVSGLADMTFNIEASAVTTAGSYYPDTTFDEGSGLFTIPYKANSTSGGLYEHGDNSSYGDDPRLNFSIKGDFPENADDDDLAIIYFEVVNPALYVGSDADNYVLVKTNDKHQATWTDQDGATNTISGWTSGGIEETFTVTLDLELYEAGLATASVFDPEVMNIKFHNKANTWSESFQISFVCSETWT